jgi:undecaprenyl-diphosphatase
MDVFQALILSIVEGITEFLPISSTGHLVLVSKLLNLPQTEFVKSFEVFIQLGAILAIVVMYWKTLIQDTKVWQRILAAFLPTAFVGFILYRYIKEYLIGNEFITLTALLLGGVAIIILEKMYSERENNAKKISELSLKQSFLIGLVQSLSIVPGVSRAAASILGALYFGANRKTAVEFSFLLAVPTMIGASGYDLLKSGLEFSQYQWLLMLIGFVGSFFTALIVVKWFVKFVQTNTFIPFGIYRIVASVLFWLVIFNF